MELLIQIATPKSDDLHLFNGVTRLTGGALGTAEVRGSKLQNTFIQRANQKEIGLRLDMF